MSQTQTILELNGRKITLIGTAHVSKESIDEVSNTIREISPDCVAIELDEKRANAIEHPDQYRQLDIIKVLKNHEGFLMLANLVLASFQRRMGENVGVKPGDEMLAAMNVAKELNIPSVMVDRPIQITLKRAWAKNSFWGKSKLLASLLASAFSKEEVSEEEIEKLKNRNEMDSMMDDLADYLPAVKEVLIDERDKYLASNIWSAKGDNVVAVLGAGHIPGVTAHLNKLAANEESADVTEISQVPPKGIFGKIMSWFIPALIVVLLAIGFIMGGKDLGTESLLVWVLSCSVPAAVMSLIGLAHPLTIISAFICAPFTALSPLVGIGLVTGIVQATVCKPKISDMETLQNDITSIKGIYKNRILKVLLIFILSSLGTAIGNIAGLTGVVKNLLTM